MLHGHSLFADWWGKNPTNKSHGGKCVLPFVQLCQSSLETSYNYCPMVKTNIIILILKSEENRIKGLSQCHMESMKGPSRNPLFTKAANNADFVRMQQQLHLIGFAQCFCFWTSAEHNLLPNEKTLDETLCRALRSWPSCTINSSITLSTRLTSTGSRVLLWMRNCNA